CSNAFDKLGSLNIALSLRCRRERDCLSAIRAQARPLDASHSDDSGSYTHPTFGPKQFSESKKPPDCCLISAQSIARSRTDRSQPRFHRSLRLTAEVRSPGRGVHPSGPARLSSDEAELALNCRARSLGPSNGSGASTSAAPWPRSGGCARA